MGNQEAEQDPGAPEAGEEGVAELESVIATLGDRALELDDQTLAEASDEDRSEIEAESQGDVTFESATAKRSRRLSPHFVLAEFHCHDGTPVPGAALPGVRRLVRQVLEPMRGKYGACRVTSGFRTDSHNNAVGGKPASRHLYHRFPAEAAADVTFASGTPREWAAEAERLLQGAGGIGIYPSWTHVDLRAGGPARW